MRSPLDVAFVVTLLLAALWGGLWALRHARGRPFPPWAATLPALPSGVLATWAYAQRDRDAVVGAAGLADRLLAAHAARTAATAVDALWMGAGVAALALLIGAAWWFIAAQYRAPTARITSVLTTAQVLSVAAVGGCTLALADRGLAGWALVIVALTLPALHQTSWVERAARRGLAGTVAAACSLLGVALALQRTATRLDALVWMEPATAALTEPSLDLLARVLLPMALGGAVVASVPRDARQAAAAGWGAVVGLVVLPSLLVAPTSLGDAPPASLERLRLVQLAVHDAQPAIPGRIVQDCVAVWPEDATCGRLAAPADLTVSRLPPEPLDLVVALAPASDWPAGVDPWRYTWVESGWGEVDHVWELRDGTIPEGLQAHPRIDPGLGDEATVGQWVERCLAIRRQVPRATCVRAAGG